MDEENLFDDDDALDFVLYEDAEKNDKNQRKFGGCLSVILLFMVLPTTALLYLVIGGVSRNRRKFRQPNSPSLAVRFFLFREQVP